MCYRHDHYVGELLDALEKSGRADNTIVVFTSDNGGHPEYSFNRPFRGSKWNLYEGGVRIPMLVRWPGVVKAGSTCDVPVIQTDLLATFSELAGASGKSEKGDGHSIASLFRGDKDPALTDRSLIWHLPYYIPEGNGYDNAKEEIGIEDGYSSKTAPQSSIRRGNYKLLYFYESDSCELYDIVEDPGEQRDLSSIMVWDALALKRQLFKGLADANARYPMVNRGFKGE